MAGFSVDAIVSIFGWQITSVLGLIAAQVILGVAVAIKNKSFEFKKLADFYVTLIIPRLLGWLATVIVVHFVLGKFVPPDSIAIPGIEDTAFGVVVASFVGDIIGNLRALGILAESSALDRVGLPRKVD